MPCAGAHALPALVRHSQAHCWAAARRQELLAGASLGTSGLTEKAWHAVGYSAWAGSEQGGCRSVAEWAHAWCCASACRSYLVGGASAACDQKAMWPWMSRLVRRYGLPGCGAPPLAPSSITLCFFNVSDGTASGMGVFACHVNVVHDNSFEIDRTARSADSYECALGRTWAPAVPLLLGTLTCLNV